MNKLTNTRSTDKRREYNGIIQYGFEFRNIYPNPVWNMARLSKDVHVPERVSTNYDDKNISQRSLISSGVAS